jgi:hypothetical protein
MDDSTETVDAFAAALFDHVERSGAERLVLDLRGNVGGNGFLNRPLMLGIVRARRLWNPGALFVLIDRGTFSAALMLAAELETWTPALFAGEKTGGDPNGYGDSRRRVLPETGLTVRVSTLYWQTTDPRDARDGIAPHLEAAARFEDWAAGRDPVLDQVLAPARPPAALAGSWAGHLTIDHSRLDFRLRLLHAAGRWTARLDLPGQGVSDVARQRVAIEGGTLTFEWESDDGPWRFRVRPAGDRLLGVVEYRGHALPMIGARAAAP